MVNQAVQMKAFKGHPCEVTRPRVSCDHILETTQGLREGKTRAVYFTEKLRFFKPDFTIHNFKKPHRNSDPPRQILSCYQTIGSISIF